MVYGIFYGPIQDGSYSLMVLYLDRNGSGDNSIDGGFGEWVKFAVHSPHELRFQ